MMSCPQNIFLWDIYFKPKVILCVKILVQIFSGFKRKQNLRKMASFGKSSN